MALVTGLLGLLLSLQIMTLVNFHSFDFPSPSRQLRSELNFVVEKTRTIYSDKLK